MILHSEIVFRAAMSFGAFVHGNSCLTYRPELHRLCKVMRARVGEDQGSVEAVNRAVYATCAALVWHQGLGADALALADGRVSTPSKVMCCTGRFMSLLLLLYSLLVLHHVFCAHPPVTCVVYFCFFDTLVTLPVATLVL